MPVFICIKLLEERSDALLIGAREECALERLNFRFSNDTIFSASLSLNSESIAWMNAARGTGAGPVCAEAAKADDMVRQIIASAGRANTFSLQYSWHYAQGVAPSAAEEKCERPLHYDTLSTEQVFVRKVADAELQHVPPIVIFVRTLGSFCRPKLCETDGNFWSVRVNRGNQLMRARLYLAASAATLGVALVATPASAQVVCDSNAGLIGTATGTPSFACGNGATASGNFGVAVGPATIAFGLYSTALGNDAQALGTDSLAVGQNAHATADFATAIRVRIESH